MELSTFIEMAAGTIKEIGRTNSHTRDFIIMLNEYDVTFYKNNGLVKIIVTMDGEEFLRFEKIYVSSMRVLQVLTAVWKFCGENVK